MQTRLYNQVTHGIFLQSIVWLVYICKFVSYSFQYNTITSFKEGDVITCNSFLTYSPLKEFCNQHCSWGRLKKLGGENFDKFSHCEWSTKLSDSVTLSVQRVTKINFLFTTSIYNEEKRLWELKKWSLKGKCFWSFIRSFAWWRHFTTTNRILQDFAFLCKLGLLLFYPHWDYQIKIWKEKRKVFWS